MPLASGLVAALCALTTLLALNVSWGRIVHRVPHGEGPNHELSRSIRAHGNSVEHLVPLGLMLLAAGLLRAPAIAVGILGGAAIVARVLLSYGILAKGRFSFRRIGAWSTYAIELGLVGLVAYTASR